MTNRAYIPKGKDGDQIIKLAGHMFEAQLREGKMPRAATIVRNAQKLSEMAKAAGIQINEMIIK